MRTARGRVDEPTVYIRSRENRGIVERGFAAPAPEPQELDVRRVEVQGGKDRDGQREVRKRAFEAVLLGVAHRLDRADHRKRTRGARDERGERFGRAIRQIDLAAQIQASCHCGERLSLRLIFARQNQRLVAVLLRDEGDSARPRVPQLRKGLANRPVGAAVEGQEDRETLRSHTENRPDRGSRGAGDLLIEGGGREEEVLSALRDRDASAHREARHPELLLDEVCDVGSVGAEDGRIEDQRVALDRIRDAPFECLELRVQAARRVLIESDGADGALPD